MEYEALKSMTATPPEAEGQTLREEDIPADIDGELPRELPTSTRSPFMRLRPEIVVALKNTPIERPVTMAELLGPGQHLRECDLHKEPPPLESSSGTSSSPVLSCKCAHLANILICPEDLVYDRDPSGKVVDVRMNSESYLKRSDEVHYDREHEMTPLSRGSSDVDSELMDPTDVDAIEKRIRESKDVSTSGRIGRH